MEFKQRKGFLFALPFLPIILTALAYYGVAFGGFGIIKGVFGFDLMGWVAAGLFRPIAMLLAAYVAYKLIQFAFKYGTGEVIGQAQPAVMAMLFVFGLLLFNFGMTGNMLPFAVGYAATPAGAALENTASNDLLIGALAGGAVVYLVEKRKK